MDVIVIGGGIGGLTLALCLHDAGIGCRVYEQAPQIDALGVGINILPHATRELARLGLDDALARESVATREAAFFNRFGQLIYREPLGRDAGYDHAQYSIHRGELQRILANAVRDRLGNDALTTGWTCVGAETRGATSADAGEVLAKHLISMMQATRFPGGLQYVGYDERDLDALTEGAYPQQRVIRNAPRDVSKEELKGIFRSALRYW